MNLTVEYCIHILDVKGVRFLTIMKLSIFLESVVRTNVFFTLTLDGFGGLVVSILATGTRVCGFKPG